MNKKVITSSVLTALMMGGFSGVQAADLEARVVVLETAVQGLGEKVGAMDPGAVAAEKTAREDEDTKIRGEFAEADKKLDEKITAEAKAREDGDKALDGKIIDLNGKVADETAAREEADKTLGEKITAEETARKDEDTKIRGEFAEADKKLGGKITDEETARKAEDTKIRGEFAAADLSLIHI